jgi:cystathionine gamma-synthase
MTGEGFATRAIHTVRPDRSTGAVNVPIFASSTFQQDGVGGLREGYEYGRTGNPTRRALEATLASLESGHFARAFSSGLAASDAVLRALLRPGDHLVMPNDAYGGTFRLIDKELGPWGLAHTPVDIGDIDAVRAAMRPETQLVWIETPTNPLLTIADITAIVELAHASGAKVVVDNTFATPYLQRPLELGADVVVHSTTKYLGGHSDVVGGAVICSEEALDEQFGGRQNNIGAIPGPFDAYLTLRGTKTLAVRMERHCANAAAVAEFLCGHRKVQKVLYPGLADHRGHDVAAKQMSGFGGMVAFRIAGGRQAALDVCARTEVFILAESLGGVESLIEHPGAMTHASTVGSELEVPDDLVRLSVGIEDSADLVADLANALG